MRGWTETIRPAHLTCVRDTSRYRCLSQAAVAQVAPSSRVVGSVEHPPCVVTRAIQDCHDLPVVTPGCYSHSRCRVSLASVDDSLRDTLMHHPLS